MKRIGLFILLLQSFAATAQDSVLTKKEYHVSGTLTATQNGISLIPSFSLNRPALLFDFNTGGKKLTFEPMFRFGTNGRPWAFVFWWRYKLANTNKFKMSIGAHPSYLFNYITADINGVTQKITRTDRYFAFDLTPTLVLAKNITAGVYYLQGHGLDKSALKYSHFLTLNASFNHIKLAGPVFAKFSPQVYYLNMAGKKGYYYTHTITLAHDKIPFSLQSIFNKALDTEIAGKSIVTNLSLVYYFNKKFTAKK